VYASVHTASGIKVFNATTFLLLGTISGPEVATKLAVDSTGGSLFAGYNAYFGEMETLVFDTGRNLHPPLAYDFNGDGHPDYLLYNGSTRRTAIWYMNNNAFVSAAYGPTLPVGWTVAGVADFNRDSKPDFVLVGPSTPQTAIWYLHNNVFVSAVYGPTVPSGWQLVATGDLNRDGKPDFVLYNPSTRRTAIWYLNN